MKLLLVTDIPPCTNFTAGLVLDRLVSFLAPGTLALCAVVNPDLHPIFPEALQSLPKLLLVKPREASHRILPGIAGDALAYLSERAQSRRVSKTLVPRIAEFARQQKVDAIWVVLQGQTMVRVAAQLPGDLGLPLYTQVWDPFGWWLRANCVDSLTKRGLLAQFDRVISASAACATASGAMSAAYTMRYRVRNRPVIAGLPRELAREPATRPHATPHFTIAVAGQFYARTEWDCLIRTLESVHWNLGGRVVKVRVMGGGFQAYTQQAANFEYLGWRTQEDTIRLLSEADLLYLPYWFSEEFREEASNSFPSKLVTYFAAGRPVFCHAPPYASPAVYLREHQAAFFSESLDPPAVARVLGQALDDVDGYRRIARNGAECFRRDFTLERMRETFLEFLGMREWCAAGRNER